jgi:ferredoxin-thioredoxin reductase catalytic subunit
MSARHKTPRDAHEFIGAVARHNGWALNSDDEFRSDLADGLAHNYNKYGYFLCPCRDGDADRESDRDIICPCDYARPDLEEHGHCFCGLFLTRTFAASDAAPRPIPERRQTGI